MKLNTYSKSVEKNTTYSTSNTRTSSQLSDIFKKNEYRVNKETNPSQQNNKQNVDKEAFIHIDDIPLEEETLALSSISIWKQQPLEEINNYLSKLLNSYLNLKTEILKIFYLATKATLKTFISNDFNNYTTYVKNCYDDTKEETKFLKELFYELTESNSLIKQNLEIICNPYHSNTNDSSIFNKTYQKIHANIYYYMGKECCTSTSEKLLKLIISKTDSENLKQNKITMTYIDSSITHLKEAINFLKKTKKIITKTEENRDFEKNIFHLNQYIDILELPIVTKLDINNITNELINMHTDLTKSASALIKMQEILDSNTQLSSIINIVAQKRSFITGFCPQLKAASSELSKITKISKPD